LYANEIGIGVGVDVSVGVGEAVGEGVAVGNKVGVGSGNCSCPQPDINNPTLITKIMQIIIFIDSSSIYLQIQTG